MAYFKDAAEVYETLGRLMTDITGDDELGPKLRAANTIVRYDYREPDASVTVRLCDDEDGRVDFGESEMEPEVVMTMDADVAHEFWLGQVNVAVALARGQIKARGPVNKILRLVPLAKPAFPRYRRQLEQQGREDLINV